MARSLGPSDGDCSRTTSDDEVARSIRNNDGVARNGTGTSTDGVGGHNSERVGDGRIKSFNNAGTKIGATISGRHICTGLRSILVSDDQVGQDRRAIIDRRSPSDGGVRSDAEGCDTRCGSRYLGTGLGHDLHRKSATRGCHCTDLEGVGHTVVEAGEAAPQHSCRHTRGRSGDFRVRRDRVSKNGILDGRLRSRPRDERPTVRSIRGGCRRRSIDRPDDHCGRGLGIKRSADDVDRSNHESIGGLRNKAGDRALVERVARGRDLIGAVERRISSRLDAIRLNGDTVIRGCLPGDGGLQRSGGDIGRANGCGNSAGNHDRRRG
ncbi:unannotated protein [freshwater metagenome]|uniref:Unannotated protein n=1 Tax=freshwater metagenome TaxID=449393 RepID=A0A6J5YC09_9ZZZZ